MKLRDCKSGEDKHKWYYECYDEQFEKLQDKELKLLEIGVQRGGSLVMWQKYFPKAEVIGAELRRWRMVAGAYKHKIFYGDQADPEFLKQFKNLDIVIDDGGHTMTQQKVSFAVLWPEVKKGGCYVIEDLHTSYWPDFLDSEPTMIEVLKGLVDSVNGWAFKSDRSKGAVFKGFDDIKSIHFYQSMAFIWKS